MWQLRMAKALAALCLAAALTACGGAQGVSNFGPKRSEIAVQAQLQHLYDLTWGSPRARQAVEVIEYVKRQEGLAACLAAGGFAHSPAPFIDATSPNRPPLGWFDILVPTDESRAAVDGLGPRPFIAREINPAKKWPGRAPSPDDLTRCEEAGDISYIPAVDPELDTKLYRLVESEVKTLSVDLDSYYRSCMKGAGYSVAEGRNELLLRLEGQRSAGSAVSDAEVSAASADVRCRREHHRQAMNELDAPLQQFEADYADRLEALKRRPDELQAEAEIAASRIELPIRWL